MVKSETTTKYVVKNTDDEIIEQALEILQKRLPNPNDYIRNPDDVKAYSQLKLANKPYEIFGVFFLDTKHGVLAFEEMFRGTIDGASVYPREVLRSAMAHNAAAVIFVHNHPSGNAIPSEADKRITTRLRDALSVVDIQTLDHIIVGYGNPYSFAEHGLI